GRAEPGSDVVGLPWRRKPPSPGHGRRRAGGCALVAGGLGRDRARPAAATALRGAEWVSRGSRAGPVVRGFADVRGAASCRARGRRVPEPSVTQGGWAMPATLPPLPRPLLRLVRRSPVAVFVVGGTAAQREQ